MWSQRRFSVILVLVSSVPPRSSRPVALLKGLVQRQYNTKSKKIKQSYNPGKYDSGFK